MKNLSTFQIVILVIALLLIFGGVLAFALGGKAKLGDQAVTLNVWGIADKITFDNFAFQVVTQEQKLVVKYTQIDPKQFEVRVLEAIAGGQSPDLIVIGNDSLISNLKQIAPIPYDLISARDFKNSFIQEGELYLTDNGILALPLSIDPMVMYWNRSIFASAGIDNPPAYWDELYYLANKLTHKDPAGNIAQSGAGLGSYVNINNAREILANMFMQVGNPITAWSSDFSSVKTVLTSRGTQPTSVLSFYTQFADPMKSVYSWTNSLPSSKAYFISGKLAIYFGFASELAEIRAKNPNLNFDIAPMPEFKNSGNNVVLGRMYGISVLRTAPHYAQAVTLAQILTAPAAVSVWSNLTKLPPVQKSLKVPNGDANMAVFKNASLIAQGWLDPDRFSSDLAFKDMISSLISGLMSPQEALYQGESELNQYIPK